jgi:hypothetical protein
MAATVKIELRAESAEALKQIQRFTSGVRDSFDAVKTGSPALEARAE